MDHAVKKRFGLAHWQIISIYLVIFDFVAVNASYFLALWFRFDCRYTQIPDVYLNAWFRFVPVNTLACIIVFTFFHLYNSLWRFASFQELYRILIANVITFFVHYIGITFLFTRMPVSYFVFGYIFQLIAVIASRFSFRLLNLLRSISGKAAASLDHAMIIGAGNAGQTIIRELQNSTKTHEKAVCIIDDNPNKWKRIMLGVPVVGGRDDIPAMVEKYDIRKIYFAIPTASAKDRRDILNICQKTGCEMMTLPGIYQLTNGDVTLNEMKPVSIEDLLGREQINVNVDEIKLLLKDKVVLVTGGGGSIGSELCRQIAAGQPKQLIIFDIYENNAYDIQMELRHTCPDLNLVVLIGSVRDSKRINGIFETYHPEVVYHAAAHKHVPLMEDSPNEAIKNNVMGTYKAAYAALKYGTKVFVLISTDKAVNPTNIMGASKRLCEMVIQSMDAVSRSGDLSLLPFLEEHPDKTELGQIVPDPLDHMAVERRQHNLKVESVRNRENGGCKFVAVRFGNVLGSNGSVIPLFRKQIAQGGPVTVTHKEITRYFMTIPEAVSLVLQAGYYAWGGEIFVLDMGEPVKIDTLARNMIRLSGYEPDVDIKIEYIGLRPGEKLYEEKLMAEEGMKKTENEMIHIGKPISFDVAEFFTQLEMLAKASYANSDEIEEITAGIVKTYQPATE